MATDDSCPLSPCYAVDLRILVQQAFAIPAPVPAAAVPYGAIGERVERLPPAFAPSLVTSRNVPSSDAVPDAVRITTAQEYWSLAFPHRLFLLAPLLDLAELDMTAEERTKTEHTIVDLYSRSYHGVPLPPNVLALIRERAHSAPAEELPRWLDVAREKIMGATSMLDAASERIRSRTDLLRRGATGSWSERTVAIAEFITDILFLCRAVWDDIERAKRLSERFGHSVSLALQSLDESEETTFGRTLPLAIRMAVSAEDFDQDERAKVLEFARRRVPHWQTGLLAPRSKPLPVNLQTRFPTIDEAGEHDGSVTEVSAETAHEQYHRIRECLERQIIAQPDLCRRLALVGVAHLRGVTHQRVLLAGPTGAGKTHTARALSRALDRPFLQIDISDVTATGWKGLDVPDMLDRLVSQAGGAFGGAVIHLDEIDKVRIGRGADGNSVEAKLGLQASLLALLDGQPVTPAYASDDQIETAHLLIIGTGAFGGRFTSTAPTNQDLERWGWMPELAARWGERFCLRLPERKEAIELLRSSERSIGRRLAPLTTAIGLQIDVPEPVLAYVAEHWLQTGADYRSAAEWLLDAAKRRLIDAIERGPVEKIVLAPDDLMLPRTCKGRPRRP